MWFGARASGIGRQIPWSGQAAKMKTHNLKPSLLALTSAVCLWSLTARAVAPTELELAEAGHWAAAK